MTRTDMGDGRIVCVGGEHEDWYDRNFCIYNDVIVLRPDAGRAGVTVDSGQVEIYGYPAEVFSPTDFHTATRDADRLILVGRLGYRGTRRPDSTPVFSLDTNTYEIGELRAKGDPPGWIHRHHASYDPDVHAITVRGGLVMRSVNEQSLPNRAAHRLHLNDLRWEKIADQEEFRFFLFDQIRDGQDDRQPGADCFRPDSVPHTWLGTDSHDDDTFIIDVSGVRITVVNMCSQIRVTIEGTLTPDARKAVLDSVCDNLNRHHGVWKVHETNPNHEW
jgi:hypothetical protein